MTGNEFYDFLRDPRLHELVELNRITDDLFDIISLGENQHSKMLAWLLTPSEGHRQGDAVVKDLLEAASHRALMLGSKNIFFRSWPPDRIRTASFGSGFVASEFAVSAGDGDKRKAGRLDLLFVDPANKILVVVENKFGAKGTEAQLSRYTDSVGQEIPSKGALVGYKVGRIFLDINFDEEFDPCPQKDWVGLNYEWLKNAERRAQLNQNGAGAAAKTIISYVRKQTFQTDAGDEPRKDRLAAELALDYHSITNDLRLIGRAKFQDLWLRKNAFQRELIVFFFQNQKTCRDIGANTRASAIAGGIRAKVPAVDHNFIYAERTVVYATPPLADRFKRERYWPFYLKVTIGEDDHYVLSLVWHRQHFGSEQDLQQIRNLLSTDYPGIGQKPLSVLRRTKDAREIIDATTHHLRALIAAIGDGND